MEEPKVSSTGTEMSSEETKNDSNDVLQEANVADETEQMETEDVPVNNLGSISPVDVDMLGESSEQVAVDESVPSDILQEDAGDQQAIIVDPVSTSPEEDEAEMMPSQSVDCTEKSINISQLDIDQTGDDSSDAFDALKRSESDALQPSNEELEKHQQTEAQKDTETLAKDVEDEECTNSKGSDPKSVDSSDDEDYIGSHDNDVLGNNEDDVSSNQQDEVLKNAADPDLKSNTEEFDSHDDIPRTEPEEQVEPEPESVQEGGEGIDENVKLLADDIEEEDEAEKSNEDESTDRDTQTASEGVIEINSDEEDEPSPMAEEQEVDELEDEPEEEEEDRLLKDNEILEIKEEKQTCLNCENETKCHFKVLEDTGELRYLCSIDCVTEHREDNPDKYTFTIKVKKIQIVGMKPSEQSCAKCNESKDCHYRFEAQTTQVADSLVSSTTSEMEAQTEIIKKVEVKYLCSKDCVNDFIGADTDKYMVRELKSQSNSQKVKEEDELPKVCARSDAEAEEAKIDRENSLIRRCTQCARSINVIGKTMQWECMDFCDENCLKTYQDVICKKCSKCSDHVSEGNKGKFCVRFGLSIHQFCTSKCLNEFKQSFQPCTVCSKNLKTNDGRIQVFKKGSNKFCSRQCVRRYDEIIQKRDKLAPRECSVCNEAKVLEISVFLDGDVHKLCSNPCLSAFKFVNNVEPDECTMCNRYFERKSVDAYTHFDLLRNAQPKIFCTKECFSVYIIKNRTIMQCNWCKVSKYSFDLINSQLGQKKLCSVACDLASKAPKPRLGVAIRKAINASMCANCRSNNRCQYALEMSDSTTRYLCTYQCVLTFQASFAKARASGETPDIVPRGIAKRINLKVDTTQWAKPQPVITNVQSLRGRGRPSKYANYNLYSDEPYNPTANRSSDIPVPELTVRLEKLESIPSRVKIVRDGEKMRFEERPPTPPRVVYEHKTQVVTIPQCPKEVRNKSTMCKALTLNKAISCVPETTDSSCQTDDWLENRFIVPIPIPIFIPMPMYMYSLPVPIPVPFPLQVPTPVFIPTTRNSSQGIMKEIKKIQDKMPTDPYEAELLMMAEMVAGESKKREETDQSESDENEIEYGDGIENNSYNNEDLVQMAFKMASSGNEYDHVDLENEMTANTIASSPYGSDMDPHSLHQHQLMLLQQQRDDMAMQSNRGRKRMPPVKQQNTRSAASNKRIKREMEPVQEISREPAEKPDAHLCLKYTFGVNAWKQWVTTKNAELEKSSIRRKPIKAEILQLTADELNYSLCMFVKEVRKPNGAEYAPDTIYYLVLGIQQYLYENARIDNIFTDRYYETFTDCLDEVAKKFSVLYNDSQYIVTRVEEEHLWECKQLGAHSPHVLLSTLMFFNTKHFNLVSSDEHMELSFSHIMKHWKRNQNQTTSAKTPGSRNVLLRFYPPQSSLANNSRKKKVYEQQENEDNPLRCPVKLYEFYLSKCPESVKTRNDVFYLQPERSCVPDSPVWYSTQPLSRDALCKMLHRVKMVKEINIALLTS